METSARLIEEETHDDQVQEAHPIFTCQICVEPMQSNQKLNYNNNCVHPFLLCQIHRNPYSQQGAKH